MKPERHRHCYYPPCSARFVPTRRQLGAEYAGRRIYCCSDHMALHHRVLTTAWWRSETGKDYARDRRRRILSGEHTPKRRPKKRRIA